MPVARGAVVPDARPVVVWTRRLLGGGQCRRLREHQHDGDEQAAASQRPTMEALHRLTPPELAVVHW
jgi:hypothetical protein